MIVDSHCHLNLLPNAKVSGYLDEVVKAATVAGVSEMLCVSVSRSDIASVVALADRYPCVVASAGIHPCDADQEPDGWCRVVEASISHKKLVAIGETGLDYRERPTLNKERQKELFAQQIEMALTHGKPVIIHTRDADEDTIAIIKEAGKYQLRAVAHCFTGTYEFACRLLDLGLYVSFSGIITFKNAESLRAVASAMPSDRVLLETDSPYLAPVPFRGKTNQPAFVTHVGSCYAEACGKSYEQVCKETTDNYRALFYHEVD